MIISCPWGDRWEDQEDLAIINQTPDPKSKQAAEERIALRQIMRDQLRRAKGRQP